MAAQDGDKLAASRSGIVGGITVGEVRRGASLYKVNDLGDVSGAVNADFTNDDSVKIRLTGDVTLTFTAPSVPVAGLWLHVIQDGTGGHTLTFPALVGEVPVLDETANDETVVRLYYDGSGFHA